MKTEVLVVDPVDPDPAALARAARLVGEGSIVAFPTETVYGLAVDPDRKGAVEELRRLKGRGDAKPFTLHLADPAQVLARLSRCPWRARKLMERYWPGPLTLVLADREGSETGFRVPSGAVPQGFLRACPRGVLAPSANLSGARPAVTAQEVLSVFDGRIGAVLDGGRAPLGESSVVVRAVAGDLEILRDGIITREQVLRAATRTVLFVCTGNTCRSPMAAGILKRMLADALGVAPSEVLDRGYDVRSAGVFAGVGPASPSAVEVLAAMGCDIRDHEARQLTRETLLASDQVYTMGRAHGERARELAPEAADRIGLLDPDGGEVPDPVWGDLPVYRRCSEHLGRLVRRRLPEILGEEGP